jgi:hypothetical protein
MSKHRFIGDHKGERDRRGNLLPTVAPILCAKCRATPDDPECLCPPAGAEDIVLHDDEVPEADKGTVTENEPAGSEDAPASDEPAGSASGETVEPETKDAE